MTEVGYVIVGFVTATLSVTVGVGGGIVYVPVLTTFFDFAQKDAQGTSVAVIAPAALIATAINARRDWVQWRVVLIVSIGAVVGALGGAAAAQQLDDTVLRRLFAALLVATAARMLLRRRSS